MKLPIYELEINDDDASGIDLISLVKNPAMQVQAVRLSEDEPRPVALQTNAMKRHLTSAVIIPDKLIYRNDEHHGEYYVKFTVDAAERIANKFMGQGQLHLSNKNHVQADKVKARLIEFWRITDAKMDKAVALGFTGLPAGTVMATYFVEDPAFWNDEVMTGNIDGFSLEGLFGEVLVQASKQLGADDIIAVLDAWTPIHDALDALMLDLTGDSDNGDGHHV
ncbi:hypothetical protein I2I05_08570 [Hymenobacter sp. BT683]|uniref:Phage metallopeptidase domain-containing protein n=1 Tax=Hymenobacter jeongseonensis TaxID=2791027 RepID=A0ABS0IGG2_9BACT|nr:hypothetical protein [Hymenobacter jeongseonensis]MBF9237450.1 hypothetical protein [Hymenobacter jeongseonensis]